MQHLQLGALVALLSAGSALADYAYVTRTNVDVVTVVKTVTDYGASPTAQAAAPAPAQPKGDANPWWHGPWGGQQSAQSQAQPTSPEAYTTWVTEGSPAPSSTESPVQAPQPATSTGWSSSQPTGSTSSSNSALSAAVLNSTNFFRQQYGASPVTWDDTLANFGQSYAEKCVWDHSGGPYGENLALGYLTEALAIDGWASEALEYNWSDPGFTDNTGHFTQLVWKATTSVGCGWVNCPSLVGSTIGGWYLVCEYSPAGNYANEYAANVGTLGSKVKRREMKWSA